MPCFARNALALAISFHLVGCGARSALVDGDAGVEGGTGGAGGGPASKLCGDGVRSAGEACDGADLGGVTCATAVGPGATGTLTCSATCQLVTTGCVAIACPAGAGLQAGAPWPMQGGCPSHVGRTNTVGAQTANVLWTYSFVGDSLEGSPAVGTDKVYVGGHDWGLYAILSPGQGWGWPTHVGIAATPAVAADGTIYAAPFFSALVALSPDGKLAWSAEALNGTVRSAPAVGDDGTIYVGAGTGTQGAADAALWAFGPDGATRWSHPLGDDRVSSPAIGPDGSLYVGSGSDSHGKLTSLTADGAVRWVYETSVSIESSPAVGPDGTIFVGSGSTKGGEGALLAIVDGSLVWSFSSGAAGFSSPALGADGTVYIGSADGHLYAVTPSGALRWAFATNGEVYSSPAIGGDGTVYFGSYDGSVYAVKADGTEAWHYDTEQIVYSSPAIGADGTVYVGSENASLYAFGPPAQ